MVFKKLYIKETKESPRNINPKSTYVIKLEPSDGFEIYFTDDAGAKMVTTEMLGKPLSFADLPKPLLKQIK